jgi:regulator of sigma E protease
MVVSGKKKGLGILLGYDEQHPVVATIRKGSVAEKANIPLGSTIVRIDGKEVNSWHDVRTIAAALAPDKNVAVVVQPPDSKETKSFEITTNSADLEQIASYRYAHGLDLRERIDPRKTSNPLQAAAWGARETRDLILQFYLTIKRMFQRSIPLSNAMGPVGIVQAGAKLSERGNDWLIWFLAQISANLAVVNFLPIPIVDGGLFLFLIIEKLQGRPLSSRTQSIAQVVGLALIVSVFLFVTYQDIMR